MSGIPEILHMNFEKLLTLKPRCFVSTPEEGPRFMIYYPKGWHHCITFHDGPDIAYPVLATAVESGSWRQDFTINLPSLPDQGLIGGTEVLRHNPGTSERYWFGMQVGEGADRHIERFEWRMSRGPEMSNTGSSRWGWKLVRLGSVYLEEEGKEPVYDVTGTRKLGFTTDGRELVALWAPGKIDIGQLHFVGSGETGEMGRLWRLMVLVSCACIFFKKQQQ